jgi:hypothetical protein
MTKFTISSAFVSLQALKPSGYSRQKFNQYALSRRVDQLSMRNSGGRSGAVTSVPQHLDARLVEDGQALEAAWQVEIKMLIADKRLKTEESRSAVRTARAGSERIVRRIETARAMTMEGLKVQARAVLWRRDGEPLGPEMPDDQASDDAWTEMAELPNW